MVPLCEAALGMKILDKSCQKKRADFVTAVRIKASECLGTPIRISPEKPSVVCTIVAEYRQVMWRESWHGIIPASTTDLKQSW